jgi:Icc-related predicted phosphoesterase
MISRSFDSHHHMAVRSFSKTRRAFGNPVEASKAHPLFEPPPNTNLTNLNLPLDVVVPGIDQQIEQAGQLVFHVVGDTGGINDGGVVQTAIADAMEAQINQAQAADKAQLFYHLGDVVYYNGLSYLYSQQFYEPYKHYPAPIFAVPGNHDGDTHVNTGDPPDPEPTLTGFMKNFCDTQARFLYPYRETMTQPYVYFTLEATFATIIGLYSNIDGLLDAPGTFEQQRWLEDQLRNAPQDKCLIVAVHHPPYSLDGVHGGYADIGTALDRAMKTTGRNPNIVFSGHVHSYQRFNRAVGKNAIAYVVAGAGGYAHSPKALHKMQTDAHHNPPKTPFDTTVAGVSLQTFNDAEPGFLRISVNATTLKGEYFLVPFDGNPPAKAFDTFSINWK